MSLIINIEKSPIRNKKFRIYLLNGNKIDFGNDNCHYYIEHKNKKKREIFYKLLNNETKNLLTTLIPSQLLYETFILNGYSKNIIKNINFFNKEILGYFQEY